MIVGALGTKPIDWIRSKPGLEDAYALLLVHAICAVVGVLGLRASGQLLELPFTAQNAVAIAGIFQASGTPACESMKGT